MTSESNPSQHEKFLKLMQERERLQDGIQIFRGEMAHRAIAGKYLEDRRLADLGPAFERAVDLLAGTRVDLEALRRSREAITRSLKKTGDIGRRMKSILSVAEDELLAELAAIPASAEKALWSLEFHGKDACEWYDMATVAYLDELGRSVPREAVDALLASLRRGELQGAPLGLEFERDLSLAWFIDRFGRNLHEDALREISDAIVRGLNDWVASLEATDASWSKSELRPNLAHLCESLAVQCLRPGVRPVARRLAPVLASIQDPDGSWPDVEISSNASNHGQLYPSSLMTALSAQVLLQVFQSDKWQTSIARAIHWLLNNQERDGSWPAGGAGALDQRVVTTIEVIQALKRSTFPEAEIAVRKGEAYLLNTQSPIGLWQATGYLDDLVSIRALAALGQGAVGSGSSRYGAIGVGLMERGQELLLRADDLDSSLAIVALYHGLEMRLYGLLDQHFPSVPIVKPGLKDTIGFREALGAMERSLIEAGRGKGLLFKTQVLDMAIARDNFVHRGNLIAHHEAKKHAVASGNFLNRLLDLLS